MSCTRVPPKATFMSCMPPQIPSTGRSRRRASVTRGISESVRSWLLTFKGKRLRSPYRRGGGLGPPPGCPPPPQRAPEGAVGGGGKGGGGEKGDDVGGRRLI